MLPFQFHSLLNTTTSIMNVTTTTATPVESVPAYVGFIVLSVSVLFFGSNYLPVKTFETGDGMFFQIILTSSIWLVGLVVAVIRGFPQMYALPMLGGFFWATGNLLVVPIIKLIGIGLGTLFWNTVLLVLGWAIARFGWFNIKAEVPSDPTMNYIGVVLAAGSGLFYLFVRNEPTDATFGDAQKQQAPPFSGINEAYVDSEAVSSSTEVDALDRITTIDQHSRNGRSYGSVNNNNNNSNVGSANERDFERRMNALSANSKRALGIMLASVAGVLYAFTFTPALYVQDNYAHASDNALDYVFSLYTGILVSSVFYFTLYCALKRNRPDVYPRVVLPAVASGVMWGIANSFFFLANNALTQAITFPIVSSGPSAISALWGILLFKEIKGVRNILILGAGFACAVAGSILCGISK